MTNIASKDGGTGRKSSHHYGFIFVSPSLSGISIGGISIEDISEI